MDKRQAPSVLAYKYHDGGREAAGFKGRTGDCVTRSIAIVTGWNYRSVYDALGELMREMTGGLERSPRDGVCQAVSHRFLLNLGFELQLAAPKQYLGAHHAPADKCIAMISRHKLAVVEDCVFDTWDPRHCRRSKNGLPLLRGYYVYNG